MSVYVFGHKSPDTDSVAAAIAFAALKKAQGEDFVPVMQGKPNPETEMVLKRFGFSAPETMTDAAGKKYEAGEAMLSQEVSLEALKKELTHYFSDLLRLSGANPETMNDF